jgi:Ca2+-binding EF-hand superfamily protein
MGAKMSAFTQEEVDIYEACTCLDGSELANIHEKFQKAGGVRGKKGEEEQRIGKRIGHKTAKNLAAPRGSVQAAHAAGGGDALSQITLQAGAPGAAPKPRKVKKDKVAALPEFNNNPFVGRLAETFSIDGSGDLDFDEFLDMFHALSPKAERSVKILTMFRVYDFDGDGYLGTADLTTLLQTTTAVKTKGKKNSTVETPTPRSPESRAGSVAAASGDANVIDPRDLEDPPAQKSRINAKEFAEIVDHVMRECDLDGRGRLSFHEFERVMNRFPDVEAKFSVNLLSN